MDEAAEFSRKVQALPVDREVRDIDVLRSIVYMTAAHDLLKLDETMSPSDLQQLLAIATSKKKIQREQEEREMGDRCRDDILGREPEQVDVAGIVADRKRTVEEAEARWEGHLEYLQQSLSPAGQARLAELIEQMRTDG